MFGDRSEIWNAFLYRYVGGVSVLLLSFFAFKWLQQFQTSKSLHVPSKKRTMSKKKKKKSKKKVKSSDSDSILPNVPPEDIFPKSNEIASEINERPLQRETLPISMITRYQTDEKVIARYKRGNEWFPATIKEIRRGNEYHLKYDDGEIEYRVPDIYILPFDASESMKAAQSNVPKEMESDSEEDWQLVSRKTVSKAPETIRKPSRRKENKKLVKELLRAQAQSHGLHARWKACE
ncbi:hypothetical protein ABG067_006556 [Albugo candida]